MAAGLRRWPLEPYFVVGVFAAWPYREPGPEGFGTPGPDQEKLEEAYGRGRTPRALAPGRHYYGWRTVVLARGRVSLGTFPVDAVMLSYRGRRPIRCVSIRPYVPPEGEE